LQQLYIDLYSSRLATVAAVQGHAPAAGCFLAMACDYRIMSAGDGKKVPTIGLNETRLGIAGELSIYMMHLRILYVIKSDVLTFK